MNRQDSAYVSCNCSAGVIQAAVFRAGSTVFSNVGLGRWRFVSGAGVMYWMIASATTVVARRSFQAGSADCPFFTLGSLSKLGATVAACDVGQDKSALVLWGFFFVRLTRLYHALCMGNLLPGFRGTTKFLQSAYTPYGRKLVG